MTAFSTIAVRTAGLQAIGDASDAVQSVVAALQTRFPDEAIELTTTTRPSWRGEFAFAEVEVDDTLHQVLLYRNGTGGTLRSSPKAAPAPTEKPKIAPFSISIEGTPAGGRHRGRGGRSREAGDAVNRDNQDAVPLSVEALLLEGCWASRTRESLPDLFTALGVELRDAQPKLTSVPALQFELHSQSGDWQVDCCRRSTRSLKH